MRKFVAILAKDALWEARQKDLWVVMVGFSVLELMVSAFTVGGTTRADGPGILWMAFLYAGMLTTGRGFSREAEQGTLAAISLAPGGRWPVFWAKLAVAFLSLFGMEVVVAPLYLALFGLGLGRFSLGFVAVLMLGALGMASVGTLMGSVGLHLAGHEAAVPVLLMPLVVPVAITAVKANLALWHHQTAMFWIRGLVAVDVVLLALPLLAFEVLWEG